MQKKIAVVLDALDRKELLVAAVFILFKLGAEAVVIPLIIFFKAANRKAVRVYRNGETFQQLGDNGSFFSAIFSTSNLFNANMRRIRPLFYAQ